MKKTDYHGGITGSGVLQFTGIGQVRWKIPLIVMLQDATQNTKFNLKWICWLTQSIMLEGKNNWKWLNASEEMLLKCHIIMKHFGKMMEYPVASE